MTDILSLSVRELAQRVAQRTLSAEAVTRAYVERIEAQESALHAWKYFDAAQALSQARAVDAAGGAPGLLAGVPVAVKDVMDTADMPSGYGSPIYEAHRPVTDAAVVGAVRAAGGVVLGKTVTTEFATFKPGPTVNPRSPALSQPHTPGGSSSGSAAAVAAGMAPVAFGTQTAASIVRPASFCGIIGYKPTFGTLPTAGVKPLSPSLDTIGVLTRSVDDAAFFVGILAHREFVIEGGGRLRVGVCTTPYWDAATPAARQALTDAARLLEAAGATVADAALPDACDGLADAQSGIMNYEASLAYVPEYKTRLSGLSEPFRAVLAAGLELGGVRYAALQEQAERARRALAAVFDRFDVLLAPSAPGEAPAGLASTGDPIFSRMWTLLGNPCVNVPVGTGPVGLPVGVTVIGPRWRDDVALSAAARLEQLVGAR
ncbi:MAG TPA: amidase [Trinickia sp.]|jgi:Asp-tRNA(Asn)/Glu-tRNA(Gln) amidotransferase A subunit family amidase|nr:amidase [Trinickia sp.]